MRQHKTHKVRLSVDCTEEERRYIKMLATKHDMTISEYLLSFARAEMPKAKRPRVPNEATQQALKQAKQDSGESYETIDEFWEAMDVHPDED